MSYKVIVDSCGELTVEMKASGRFETASLGLEVGDCHIIDDESFNQAEFLKNVAECPTCPKSSCPSPETFMEGYHCDAEHVYAVTLSSELSGSYNSAVLGKNLYEEEYGEKDIYVFNSKSASVGQTLIGMHLRRVAVPVRLSVSRIGEAPVVFARTRPPYIGGPRAQYQTEEP